MKEFRATAGKALLRFSIVIGVIVLMSFVEALLQMVAVRVIPEDTHYLTYAALQSIITKTIPDFVIWSTFFWAFLDVDVIGIIRRKYFSFTIPQTQQ